MPVPPSDRTLDIPFPTKAVTSHSHSEAEGTVAELFGLLRNPVLRYLFTIGLSVQDGEEVVQEVFLALFEHLRRGGDRFSLRGWVFRVAHNLGLKRRMANQRQWAEANDSSVLHSDSNLNPEEQLVLSQKRSRLRGVLRALPESDQRCLSLRAEGLRYREIAEILGISLGAVSISLTRSLARFEQVNRG